MQAKTIKAILQKKHNQFVESIEDEKVRKIVKNHSIITGGCITSMLLGDKVNDFDYYFDSKENALEVMTYFAKLLSKKTTRNIKVQDKEDRVYIYIKSAGQAGEQDDVEDGEVNEQVQALEDCGLQELADKATEGSTDKHPYQPVFATSNAISLSGRVQLVARFFGKPEEIHENYDFVHCTCWWRSSDGHLELPAKALEAILTKELIYVGSKYPICSMFRVRKFVQRGWSINAGQILKMALQIHKLDLYNINVLQDQLVGVDSLYFMRVIEYLKKRIEDDKDFKITENYLFEVINRIF